MELIEWDMVPDDLREALLAELGYTLEGDQILDDQGIPVRDPYTGEELGISNLAVLPGASPPVLLDNNMVSLACYLEDYQPAG